MNKQKFNQIKKTLAILLAVLFIVTLTAMAVSAGPPEPEPLPIPLEDQAIIIICGDPQQEPLAILLQDTSLSYILASLPVPQPLPLFCDIFRANPQPSPLP